MDIHLETPPASPELLSLDDLPVPEPISRKKLETTSYTVISPQKKPKRHGTTSRKSRQAHPSSDEWRQSEASISAYPAEDNSEYYIPSPTAQAGIPVSPDDHGTDTSPASTCFDGTVSEDDYYVYAESVLNFVAGFFQVSATMFLVQGWDKKRESATVRFDCNVTESVNDI